jgi:hypothetical protein
MFQVTVTRGGLVQHQELGLNEAAILRTGRPGTLR